MIAEEEKLRLKVNNLGKLFLFRIKYRING